MAILGKAPGIAIYCYSENQYPHFRRDVSDATSGRNFFRIDGEVMNKDCSWQYMADNP